MINSPTALISSDNPIPTFYMNTILPGTPTISPAIFRIHNLEAVPTTPVITNNIIIRTLAYISQTISVVMSVIALIVFAKHAPFVSSSPD